MGWDAFATRKGKDLRRDWDKLKLLDPELDWAFSEADRIVREKIMEIICVLIVLGVFHSFTSPKSRKYRNWTKF